MVDKWGHNFGNAIVGGHFSEKDWENIKIVKRNMIVPCENNENPENCFIWEDIATVDKCESTMGSTLVLKCRDKHNLYTGNIIALASNGQTQIRGKNYWMLNNDYSGKSAGNGVLFKVKVLDDYRIGLYEFVASSHNNISCRHIHHINRAKDGWILGTGEIYPNSWILYIQIKKADTYSPLDARDEFTIFRLNGSEKCVQRTMGVIYYDDLKQKIFYASDHDDLGDAPRISFSGVPMEFSRGNTGIYVGSIVDIDNRSKFQCILDAHEPCFYFQELDGMIFFCGQRGELYFSSDNGVKWRKERLSAPIINYFGNIGQCYYFDSCVFKRKW